MNGYWAHSVNKIDVFLFQSLDSEICHALVPDNLISQMI